MYTKYLIRVVLAALLLISLSCAEKSPLVQESKLDRNWGTSARSAKVNQILNPRAGQNLEPVEGLDGPAAERSMKRYRKGFETKPAKDVYNLNLGVMGTR